MENKDPEGAAYRIVGIGDWVVCLKSYHDIKKNSLYRIFNKAHLDYLLKNSIIRKATKQEYIVAKLKGRLYE